MLNSMVIIGVVYLLIINAVGFFSMYSDKKKAKKKAYRTPEATLFGIALLGGSIGSIIGMQKYRHKTKHLTFVVGMPAILILQLLAFGFIFTQFFM